MTPRERAEELCKAIIGTADKYDDAETLTLIESAIVATVAETQESAISDIHARLESALAESQRRADLIDQLAAMVKETKQERDEANRRRVAVTDSGMAALTEAGERIAAVERERDEALEQAAYWQRTANEFEQESIRDLAQRDRRIDDLQRLVAWCHARLDQEHVAYVERKLSALSAPAQSKEHCPRRLMGETLAPHAPCDTGDHSRDAQPATAAKEHRPHCSYFYKDPANPDNCDCAAPPSPAARVKNADKAVCPHCGFDGPCELHDHLDAVISSTHNVAERLRSLVERMNQGVTEPDGVYRGHCRWCSMSAATAEERHYPRCVLAELEEIADAAQEGK